MAKYSKLKMFLFMVSFVVIIVFVVQVSNILKDGFSAINVKKQELACTNIKYDITHSEYLNDKLIIELMSSTHKYNITKVTVLPDTSEQKHVTMLEPALVNSETVLFNVNNISINNSYFVYVDDCKDQGVTNKI